MAVGFLTSNPALDAGVRTFLGSMAKRFLRWLGCVVFLLLFRIPNGQDGYIDLRAFSAQEKETLNVRGIIFWITFPNPNEAHVLYRAQLQSTLLEFSLFRVTMQLEYIQGS